VGAHCPTKSASWCLSSIFKISEATIEAPAAHKNASEGSLAVCSSIARATGPSLCSLELVIQLLYEHAFSLDSLFLIGSPQDLGVMVRRQNLGRRRVFNSAALNACPKEVNAISRVSARARSALMAQTEGQTVHLRHLHIQKRQVVRLPSFSCGSQLPKGFLATGALSALICHAPS
jgi:hypothetical protein